MVQNMKPAFDLEYFLFERRNQDNGNTHNSIAQSVLARVQLEELKFTADTLMLKAREYQVSHLRGLPMLRVFEFGVCDHC